MEGRSRFVQSQGQEVHITEWGDPQAPPVFCWHGLARTGRDFDELAERLAATYYVVCPDTPGRGQSQWAQDRERDYCFALYAALAEGLCETLKLETVRWVGTSMGGLIGLTLAAGAFRHRLSHLVLNDIGPEVPESAVARIVAYVGNPPTFATYAELQEWLETVYQPFGVNPPAFWTRMAQTSARRTDAGALTVHYDPRIVSQFTTHPEDLSLWEAYDTVTTPTLLLRGAHSDVLPAAVAEAMTQRGPCPRLVEFPNCGHAPTLTSADQASPVLDFLAS